MKTGRQWDLPTKHLRLYWDSNCFISLFDKQVTADAHELQALIATYNDMLDGKVQIVTSELLFQSEVFGGKTAEGQQMYQQLNACPNFDLRSSPSNMGQLVGALRSSLYNNKQQNISAADAMHVITAIKSRVNEMWTTDKGIYNKGQANLLGAIQIRKPYIIQQKLDI